MSWKFFKLMLLLVVVLSVGVAFANEPKNDADPWFGNAAGDGGLWTTGANWWRGSPPGPADGNGAGHDAWDATLRVNDTMGTVRANSLYVGDWGPGAGTAYFSMDSGLLILDEELMIGYRGYASGSWTDGEGVEHTWSNWGHGSATIHDGIVSVGSELDPNILGIGSTDFGGYGGVGELLIEGGIIRARDLVFGVIDPLIPGTALSVDITDGQLLLLGDISSLDPRVTAFGGVGILHFDYEMTSSGYTTVWAEIPEPATVLLLGLGGLAFRRKRA
jgi:hypothetical protein